MTRALLLSAFAVLAACSAPPAEEQVDAAIADPEPCVVEGMNNCARTGDWLIGGQPNEEALESLAAQGVTTIVSTRGVNEVPWDERGTIESLGMTFVQIPMPGPVTEITDAQIAALDDVLENADGPVVLHCGSGNRVSGLWAAWLVAERGIDPTEALRLAELAGMRSVRGTVEQRLGIEAATAEAH